MSVASKRNASILAAAFGLAAIGLASYSNVRPSQFGLQEIYYTRVEGDILKPGIRGQIPLLHFTHTFNAKTQTISYNAGGCRFKPGCESTGDHNPLRVELELSYRVIPDRDKLTAHLWDMEGYILPDGYWLLTEMMNTSANAALGKQSMIQHLDNPKVILKNIHDDLAQRLTLNNIPVEIERLEIKSLNTSYIPTRFPNYDSISHDTKIAPP